MIDGLGKRKGIEQEENFTSTPILNEANNEEAEEMNIEEILKDEEK